MPQAGARRLPAAATLITPRKKDASTSANRDVLGVRVVTPFTRADGTTAQAGDLLLKHRFALSRLAGLTYQGIDTTDKTTLVNGVPLSRNRLHLHGSRNHPTRFRLGLGNGGHIVEMPLIFRIAATENYCGPNGTTIQSSIATLDQVAKYTDPVTGKGREPNFFELLKAAMLSGSLGRDAGARTANFMQTTNKGRLQVIRKLIRM